MYSRNTAICYFEPRENINVSARRDVAKFAFVNVGVLKQNRNGLVYFLVLFGFHGLIQD